MFYSVCGYGNDYDYDYCFVSIVKIWICCKIFVKRFINFTDALIAIIMSALMQIGVSCVCKQCEFCAGSEILT